MDLGSLRISEDGNCVKHIRWGCQKTFSTLGIQARHLDPFLSSNVRGCIMELNPGWRVNKNCWNKGTVLCPLLSWVLNMTDDVSLEWDGVLVGTEYIGERRERPAEYLFGGIWSLGTPSLTLMMWFRWMVRLMKEFIAACHFQVHFYTLAISAGEWTLLAIRSLSSWTEEAPQPLSTQENQTCIGIVLWTTHTILWVHPFAPTL